MNEPANQTPSSVHVLSVGDVEAVRQCAARLAPAAAGVMAWSATSNGAAGAINVRLLQPLDMILAAGAGRSLRLMPRVLHQRHLLVAVVDDDGIGGWVWDESLWVGPSGRSGWSM